MRTCISFRRGLSLGVYCLLLLTVSLRAFAQTYRVINLGTLGGSSSRAYGINNSGQVVGESRITSGWPHAFLWQNGHMTDLGTLGGSYSHAYSINNIGQVVGNSLRADNVTVRAFLWQNGDIMDLGGSHAYSINNIGQVVGEAASHAFLWQNGIMIDLGTLGGNISRAFGINNSGQVVGESRITSAPSGPYHAFLWQNGHMIDLGTLGGSSSYAYSINNSGQVVGGSRTASGAYHAVLWQNGHMTDLDPLGGMSEAYSINNSGQVVGKLRTASGAYHVFLWQNGVMTDLTNTTGINSSVYDFPAINDHGQIVTEQYLLLPVSGLVFNPDPVTTSGNNMLTNTNNEDILNAQRQRVGLLGLVGNGNWTLTGQYVVTTRPVPFVRANEPTQVYDYPRNDPRFHEVMCYYHTDMVERYIQSLGFAPVGPHRAIQNRQVQIDVDANVDCEGDPLTDNSYYCPDGNGTGKLVFGIGGVPDAEDAMIIWHENGHAIQDNQVHNFGSTHEGRAMGEGFGDYWAASRFAGMGVHGSAWDIYVMRWDATGDPLAHSATKRFPAHLRRLDSDRKYHDSQWGMSIYDDGEIWSRCLWDIRGIVGRIRADTIILESHFSLSPSAQFGDGALSILAANQARYSGQHQAAIRKVFVCRGILLPSLTNLTLNPSLVFGGKSVSGKVTLDCVAPPGGAVITLTNTNPAATVPTTVTVPAGQTFKTFTITTTAASSRKTGTVTATYDDVSINAALTVLGTPKKQP